MHVVLFTTNEGYKSGNIELLTQLETDYERHAFVEIFSGLKTRQLQLCLALEIIVEIIFNKYYMGGIFYDENYLKLFCSNRYSFHMCCLYLKH